MGSRLTIANRWKLSAQMFIGSISKFGEIAGFSNCSQPIRSLNADINLNCVIYLSWETSIKRKIIRTKNQSAKAVCVFVAACQWGVFPIAVDFDFSINQNLYISMYLRSNLDLIGQERHLVIIHLKTRLSI